MINHVSKKSEPERQTNGSGLCCQTSHCKRENDKRIISTQYIRSYCIEGNILGLKKCNCKMSACMMMVKCKFWTLAVVHLCSTCL